ncbi:MAG TPA: winged helix-turn-helix transcriptional regulator [Gammaproteobacteria bacterium]|nr:winged helix-turn-helix transcriptional regulator [Gammaproteobacteria bacterium]
MSNKRSYSDACGAAHAMDLIGERWALLVARELMLGPKRFTDLRASLPSISPNVLTQRLEDLEEAAVVRRHKLPPPASAWVYELTDWGRELEPALQALGRWAVRSPHKPDGMPISLTSLILSFRTMFSSAAAEGLKASLEIRLGDERFQAMIGGGQLHIERGAPASPDAVIETSPGTLAALVYGGHKLADALQAGEVKLEGDKSLVKRFLTLFPLPALAPA